MLRWPASGDDSAAGLSRALPELVVALVGVVVLIGWGLDVETLKSGSPSFVSMKANSAASFALCGVSLLLVRRYPANRKVRLLGSGLAVVVFLVGLLTLSEYVLGWNLGLDELLFDDNGGAVNTPAPGRMGANTAVCFMLASGSILLIASARRSLAWLAQAGALTLGAIALFSFAGYVYGAQQLKSTFAQSVTPMALHTSLTFFVLMAAVLVATPGTGVMRLLASPGAGAVMTRRLVLSFTRFA